MKIACITPWEMKHIGYMRKYFEPKGYTIDRYSCLHVNKLKSYDVIILMWADVHAIDLTNYSPKMCKYIVTPRSYEMFSSYMKRINWGAIDHVAFCSKWMLQYSKLPHSSMHVIPNVVDTGEWEHQVHGKGKDIAMICSINHKKGLQMMPQIMAKLPEDYTMHVAGKMQEPRIWEYQKHIIRELGLFRRVKFYGQVTGISGWLKDKDYILSTSLTEGHPMNILESMASGIKPVIHNWAGSKDEFDNKWIFNTVDEAVEMILSDDYDTHAYRDFIENSYSPDVVYPRWEKLICT